MRRIVLLLFLVFTGLVANVMFKGTRPVYAEAIAQQTTEITQTPVPVQTIVPGAAPDFQAESRQAFNIINALQNPDFIRTFFKWGKGLQLNQGGSIWVAVVITLLVAFDFKNLKSRNNLDLLLLLLPSFFLVDLIPLGNTPEDISQTDLFGFLFLGLILSTLILFIRSLYRGLTLVNVRWQSNLPRYILAGLAIFLILLNTFQTLVRNPDDAGNYTNLGAYHMLKTGNFPYGNPELRGGAAATYGPVLYIAHMPFQLVLTPITNILASNPDSLAHRIVVGNNVPNYDGPPVMATKLTLLAFLYLAVGGLFQIGKKYGDHNIAWALPVLFLVSPYVQGLGGENWYITGVTYMSHIAPTALTLWAFLAIKRPTQAGILLAIGAGLLFYPAFLFPLWFGYYFWRREGSLRFLAGFGTAIVIIFILVLLLTQSGPNETAFGVIYESTVGHQEASNAYGSSTFSFWGTQPGLAALWQRQLIPGVYLLRPSVLIFVIFIGASFFLSRGRNLPQLAFLTAAVIIAVQLWKSHAGGTYVEWYYPFFLIGMTCLPKLAIEEVELFEPAQVPEEGIAVTQQ